ncbi:myxosortase-dependent metalloprotease, MXAN_2677/MXAN_2678 family [Corallococcus silvisoli]|uniref:myxosortase-dependent metalloprotease, MXAN_2677/MXAN_2678 family n=1 Tax=Corallococcus silvisoli TaxID=2697031 RepID=UPI0013787D33|nr:myxosortase-dependent metalloprotease, MXAN_2677/MXAN_2678 family [Corallococcus silvisoli]NBD10685.1 matrixin family metalloprotease [Corallococcus silvisoli]
MSRRLLLLGWLLCAGAAGAQQDYRRTLVPGRPLCLVWPGRDYVYHLDAAGSSRTPGDTEVAAIEAAFDAWRALSATCSDYRFIRGEDWKLPVAVGYDQEHPFDNYNVITFRERNCQDVAPADDVCWQEETCGNVYQCWAHGGATIGLTTSSFSFKDGRVVDADIELNAAQSDYGPGFLFTTVNGPPCEGTLSTDCVATDVQNTMTHEIGHVIGLDHVFSAGSTMEATASLGETSKRVIDAGSAAGFCATYPRGLPPTQCRTPVDPGLKLVADGKGTGCDASSGGPALAAGLLWAAGGLRRRRSRRATGPLAGPLAAAPGSTRG